MKRNVLLLLIIQFLAITSLHSQEIIRLGIIGLDTSHSEAFIKLINGAAPTLTMAGIHPAGQTGKAA